MATHQEYTKWDRVTLTSGGSSAHLLKEEEMTWEDRRRKDSESGHTDDHYIDMLCQRYHDRGVAGKVHADAARQQKQEALDRAIAPGAYVMTEKLSGKEQLDHYRSGLADGKRFMTVDDFDRYYHDQRGYKFPQYRAATVRTARHDPSERLVETAETGKVLSPKKASWLTDKDKCPAWVQKLLRYKAFQKLNEWAGETFPRENEMICAKHVRAKSIPASVVASLVVVAVSMSLVISSTVLVSRSTMEVSQLKGKLAERQEILRELSDDLDMKNDLLGIRDMAVNQLGMVSEKYVSGEHLDSSQEDYLEVFGDGAKEDKDDSGWAAILSAFGWGD